MPASQIEELSRLAALIIPILLLFVIGQVLRFDPNRRVVRPSKALSQVRHLEYPWRFSVLLARLVLIVLLIGAVLALIAQSIPALSFMHALPAWLQFDTPTRSVIYALLALVAIWLVRQLKRQTIGLWDYAMDNDLDFSDWRYADPRKDARPPLRVSNYRFRMKWWFKTNLEPITALQLRMIFENPAYADLKAKVDRQEFPPAYGVKKNGKSHLQARPWGLFLGNIASLMKSAVVEGIFFAPPLWEIWRGQVDQRTGQVIITKEQMANMLYLELRNLILCPECRSDATLKTSCSACQGSGAWMPHCPTCGGAGLVKTARCPGCDGLGFHHVPIPIDFLERVQYLWAARNANYVQGTFRFWLTNFAQAIMFVTFTAIFLVVGWLSGIPITGDTIVESLLFAAAALLGVMGVAIILIFGSIFNSSGTFYSSFPLRIAKFGDVLWLRFTQVIAWLAFGTLLIDTTFVMSQFLFARSVNLPLIIAAIATLTTFAILFSLSGIMRIHTAMRDAKRSRLDELDHWLNRVKQSNFDTSQEEALYKEVRDLAEWPVDGSIMLGVVSGVVLPVVLTLISVLASNSLIR
jgi:uncharacterized integral membrane protein